MLHSRALTDDPPVQQRLMKTCHRSRHRRHRTRSHAYRCLSWCRWHVVRSIVDVNARLHKVMLAIITCGGEVQIVLCQHLTQTVPWNFRKNPVETLNGMSKATRHSLRLFFETHRKVFGFRCSRLLLPLLYHSVRKYITIVFFHLFE